jgi:hypothetical protein
MKPTAILSTMLVVIVAVGIIPAVWQLTKPTFSNVNQELEYIVTDIVKSNEEIKNCVLFVKKGDGSFTWAGAAGIASQDGQVPMTKDTPIYLASLTKLYTAAAIMRLYEQGTFVLDDPMAKYLPDDLIRGIHVYQGHDYSGEITIAQLLAHTSGIADYYSPRNPKMAKPFSRPSWQIKTVHGRLTRLLQGHATTWCPISNLGPPHPILTPITSYWARSSNP